jgi:Flp pilus assembly protein TadG
MSGGRNKRKNKECRRLSKRAERGFVLIGVAISVVILLGMLGLVFDIGRSLVAKNEAQAFTDSAALAAARRLNGLQTGIDMAREEVTSNRNRWNFASKSFTGVEVEFSRDRVAWSAMPSAPLTNVKYVRVTAPSNPMGMLFLPVVRTKDTMNIRARSVAGIELGTTFQQGVFPFAPFAKDATGPNFGYNFGDELTLLWPSSVGSNGQSVKMNNLCAADRNQAALDAVKEGRIADRGYIQETSAAAIAAAIEDDHMDYTVTLGMPVKRSGGVKTMDVNKSLADRVAQDTSPNEPDYFKYINTHDESPMRRIVVVPIISDAVDAIVLGFVRVFLPPNQNGNPNNAKCAMFIGPADEPPGHLGSGINALRLVE